MVQIAKKLIILTIIHSLNKSILIEINHKRKKQSNLSLKSTIMISYMYNKERKS
jgi:hypothetical protein